MPDIRLQALPKQPNYRSVSLQLGVHIRPVKRRARYWGYFSQCAAASLPFALRAKLSIFVLDDFE